MEKKNFSQNAKNFLSDWKQDFESDNKHIMERKQQRDEETARMTAEFKKLWEEYKGELQGKSKELLTDLIVAYNSFAETFKAGTAALSDKIQLEKRMDEFSNFIKNAGEKSSEKIDALLNGMQAKVRSIDKELFSEKI